jgi:hypothetical protein
MATNEAKYGDSGFRRFDTFDSSGIKVVHSNETPTAPSRSTPTHRGPTMSPMSNMTYQESHKKPPLKMKGNRPVRQEAPSTGQTVGEYDNILADLGADETDPITAEERQTAEIFCRDELGESQSNVF